MIPCPLITRILFLAICAGPITGAAAAEESDEVALRAGDVFNAAESALHSKDYAAATKLYERVLSTNMDEALQLHAGFRASEAQFLSGNISAAANGFREYVERYPKGLFTGSAYYYLGEIALQSSEIEKSIALFSLALENCNQGPPMARARLGFARALLEADRLEEIPIVLGRLTNSADPDVAAEALLILGRAKYEAGQCDAALDTFRRVYELPAVQVNLARARLAAGWSLWKSHRCEEIQSEVLPFVEDADCDVEFHYLLGMAAYSMKDWGEAIDRLGRAGKESNFHRAPAMFYLGESYLRCVRHADAKIAFQQLVDEYPDSEWADDAVWGMARTARSAKLPLDWQAAVDLLKARYSSSEYISQIPLLEYSADFAPLESVPGIGLFEEAVGNDRDGDFDAALSAYHEFLKSETTDALRSEGLWRTARLHDRLKQYAEAMELYSQVLAEFPEFGRTPEVLTNIARIAETTGKTSQAAKHYRSIVDRFPESPLALEAAYWLALAAADEQRSDEALAHVAWLLDRLDTNRNRNLWLQTLSLQCQLCAADNQWQRIAELLDPKLDDIGAGADHHCAAVPSARLAFWRAEAALRLDNVDDASERFDALVVKIIGINESWVPMVTLRRAQIAARREVWQEVLKLVGKLDERHPEFELAYECDYLRGRALAGRGEMSAARSAYGDVLENEWAAGTETAAMAQWMIGETYFHQRNYELADVAYQRVIERHDFPEWQARAALQAGKCAELLDNWDQAAELYAEALEQWQGSNSTKELGARLRWVQEQVAQREATLRR